MASPTIRATARNLQNNEGARNRLLASSDEKEPAKMVWAANWYAKIKRLF